MPTLEVVVDGLTEAIAADETAAASFEAHATLVGVTRRGPETDERYQELVDAVNVHCPVLDIVANPVPIDGEVKFA